MPLPFQSHLAQYYRSVGFRNLSLWAPIYKATGYRGLPLSGPFYRALGYYPTSIRGTAFKCSPSDFAFWRNISCGTWEPWTLDALGEYLTPDSVYCDIGAHIGSTVLFAAKKCRQVYCFEPDPVAFQHLLKNLALNRLRNVMPFNLALSDRDGTLALGSNTPELGESITSALCANAPNAFRVLALTWKSWSDLVVPEKPNLIKMDIEGGEFTLIPSMADYLASTKPALHLSTHPDMLEPGIRQHAMQALAHSLAFYKTCRDERMKPVSIDAFLSPENVNEKNAFFLTP